jgi:hypothetical protein
VGAPPLALVGGISVATPAIQEPVEVEVGFISDKKRFMINAILGLLFAFSILFYYQTIVTFSALPKSGDFVKFYMSIKYFWEGKDIYRPIPNNMPETLVDEIVNKFTDDRIKTSKPSREPLHPNLNPPFQTLLFAPLGLMNYKKAFLFYSFLSIVSGLVAIIMITNEIATIKHEITALISLMIIILFYFPTWANIVYGQFSLILLLLITSAWIAARKGRNAVCGICLGLAMSLKLFVGLFLLFFLVRRRWRLLFWFIITFLLLSLLPLLIMGVEAYRNYFAVLSEITWYAASWNASFLGFFTRIFGGSENVPLFNLPKLAVALTRICSLIFALWLVRLAWPRPQESSQDHFDLGFSLTTTGMLLISPLGWMYYFTVLIIPAAVAWRLSMRLDSRIRYQAIIILAWLLSTIPHSLIPPAEVNTPQLWFTWAGVYFYSLLLFSFLLIILARQLNRVPVPVKIAPSETSTT